MKFLYHQIVGGFIFLQLIAFNQTALAQANAVPDQMLGSQYVDSITKSDLKTPDGFYYKTIPIKHEAGGRVFIHFFAYKKNKEGISLGINNSINTKPIKYFSEVLNGSKTGSIKLYTVFTTKGVTNILFTTDKPGDMLNFTAFVFYTPPQLLSFTKDANICQKVQLIMQHSTNGFHFIKKNKKLSSSEYETTLPFFTEAPLLSSVHKSNDAFWDLSYQAKIALGNKDQISQTFSQLVATIKNCYGNYFSYSETKTDKGLSVFVSTFMSGIDKNSILFGQYSRDEKNKVPGLIVTFKMKEERINGEFVYSINLEVQNLFYNP